MQVQHSEIFLLIRIQCKLLYKAALKVSSSFKILTTLWLLSCFLPFPCRYIAISQETKNILGDNKSSQLYLADRLNTTPEVVEDICARIPALKTIRVTKVCNFLSIILNYRDAIYGTYFICFCKLCLASSITCSAFHV